MIQYVRGSLHRRTSGMAAVGYIAQILEECCWGRHSRTHSKRSELSHLSFGSSAIRETVRNTLAYFQLASWALLSEDGNNLCVLHSFFLNTAKKMISTILQIDLTWAILSASYNTTAQSQMPLSRRTFALRTGKGLKEAFINVPHSSLSPCLSEPL